MAKSKDATPREAIEAEESATTKMKKKPYEEELAHLQLELIKLQEWIKHAGLKVVVIFEGRDAAGKNDQADHREPGTPGPVVPWPPRPSASAAVVLPALRGPPARPGRWSCSTAAGTTGPGSSG